MGLLDGQVAIVTGAGTGIGREAAKMLSAEGAHVVVTGRRKAPLDSVVTEIGAARGRATARAVDIEDREAALGLVQWTIDTFGRIDVLVNNAGYSSRARSIRWVQKDDWDGVINVNLNAVYTLTQAVLPNMIERGGGTIVTVSSAAALRPGLIGGAPYGAAKAGVRNHDHAGRGRHADLVAPPAGARRQGTRHDDAGGGRGACGPALRDASAADRDRRDRDEPDHRARLERRRRGGGARGRARRGALIWRRTRWRRRSSR